MEDRTGGDDEGRLCKYYGVDSQYSESGKALENRCRYGVYSQTHLKKLKKKENDRSGT